MKILKITYLIGTVLVPIILNATNYISEVPGYESLGYNPAKPSCSDSSHLPKFTYSADRFDGEPQDTSTVTLGVIYDRKKDLDNCGNKKKTVKVTFDPLEYEEKTQVDTTGGVSINVEGIKLSLDSKVSSLKTGKHKVTIDPIEKEMPACKKRAVTVKLTAKQKTYA